MGKDAETRTWRFQSGYVIPTLLLLIWAAWPLIRGTHTLYLRDILNVHLEKKWVQAQAMADGYLPLLDPYRDGGQPLLGNLNSVALYPDNILLLLASPLWVLNAHFWIHLLLAPFSAYWLARSWGLRREAAWAAGVFFTASGFFFSMLNLYNMVAGIALAPAFIAAMMGISDRRRRASRLVAVSLLWCLLLLSGDPMVAAMTLILAISAGLTVSGTGRFPWRWSLAGVGLGTVLAAPQLVEFLRVLPLSYRGYWGFSPESATVGSWHPAAVLELLLPFAFGRPDFSFWGSRFYAGVRPLLLTLYPGVVSLWLLLLSGRPRTRLAWWSWAVIAVGVFFVLGSFNPFVVLLWKMPGASLLRLPIKFWLLIAIGASLLSAVGFQRLLDHDRPRPLAGVMLGATGALFLVGWLWLTLAPGPVEAWLRGLISPPFGDALAAHERVRWAGLCLLSLVALAGTAIWLLLGRRWPRVLGPGILLTHLVFQYVVLRPAIPTDEVGPYLAPSPLAAIIPEEATIMYGKGKGGFGGGEIPLDRYPDTRALWLQRQVFAEFQPVAGIMAGRRYAFSISPEGLDSFLTRVVGQALEAQDDKGRVRLLAASGVEYLLVGRELALDAVGEAELVGRSPTVGGEMFAYRLLRVAPEVALFSTVSRAPHLNQAIATMVSDGFDPQMETVLPEGGPEQQGSPGVVRVVASGPERLDLEVESPFAGALVAQRAFLPLYKAEVDGVETPIVAANAHRLGIELPAGKHRVEIRVDRRPFRIASALSSLAALFLLWLAWRLRNSGAKIAVERRQALGQ